MLKIIQPIGSGSDNPFAHGVEMKSNSSLYREVNDKANNSTDPKMVICDIHTHPSGVTKGYEYRMLSQADMNNNEIRARSLKDGKGITYIAGLISADNDKGNSTISFVWHDVANNKNYLISNTSIAKYNAQEQKWKKIRLPKEGKSEFLELDFGQVDYYNNEEPIR